MAKLEISSHCIISEVSENDRGFRKQQFKDWKNLVRKTVTRAPHIGLSRRKTGQKDSL